MNNRVTRFPDKDGKPSLEGSLSLTDSRVVKGCHLLSGESVGVLSQANTWGFVCHYDVQGKCQILPQKSTERWILHLVGERWLLIVGDVPQMICHPSEAIAFLERRRQTAKIFTPPSLLQTTNSQKSSG